MAERTGTRKKTVEVASKEYKEKAQTASGTCGSREVETVVVESYDVGSVAMSGIEEAGTRTGQQQNVGGGGSEMAEMFNMFAELIKMLEQKRLATCGLSAAGSR